MKKTILSLVMLLAAGTSWGAWAPVKDSLLTRWAKDVSPEKVLPEYPRPQMARKTWQNLNGLWDYAIAAKEAERPAAMSGQILVPFPVQSALSGVKKTLKPEERLWYRRTFTIPEKWAGQRVLLHFGAVDWEAVVTLNGKELGKHQGGYDPFSFDITSAIKKGGEQELVVAVSDPGDKSPIPRGKQVLEPKGIWYTAISGIWQTVWIEPVPAICIKSLKITPDVDAGAVRVEVAMDFGGMAGISGAMPAIKAEVLEGGKAIARGESPTNGDALTITIPQPKLWAPGSPFLYDLKVSIKPAGGQPADAVTSYFGMRKIEVKKDERGLNRLFLNGKALFQLGPLDQGWWPDGLYTAPTDEALKFDIEETLKMGFNMARKHVKVEPERWYYWADKLGLLVWQDMPSGDKGVGRDKADLQRTPESAEIYEREYRALIASHINHPCIVMWVPFNEGWGQFDTERIAKLTKELDPTRLVNDASGWVDRGAGDVNDMHSYPGPNMPEPEPGRAVVLGEFGGLGLIVKGHLWVIDRMWGYRDMKDAAELTDRYGALIEALTPMAARGLGAAIYTQTTDCEGEVNGLLTYDRVVNKMGAETVAKINAKVYEAKSDPAVAKPTPPPMPERKTEAKNAPKADQKKAGQEKAKAGGKARGQKKAKKES